MTSKPGNTWEKQSKRAGLLKFTETVFEFHDQDGGFVLTMRGVSVKTEKPVEQGQGGIDNGTQHERPETRRT